jgi:N-hydroxyarylamine O-acetyltransferase
MDKFKYLNRIDYKGELNISINVLNAIQEAHLLNVPFENLDIFEKRVIKIDSEIFYGKIVTDRRGGFCYELNGLFQQLLKEIGFKTKIISARVFNKRSKTYGLEFDHMAIIINIDNWQWLVDVGFGDFSLHPLKLILGQPIEDKNGKFLFDKLDEAIYRVLKFSEEEQSYIPQYKFSLTERSLSDFSGMCHYHQTSPESSFTQNKLCSVATRNGRITLTDNKLIITEDGIRTESVIRNNTEFDLALLKYFNIVLK